VIKDLGVWEELRLILNFQLEDRFLLTLLLLGQPELNELVDSNKQFLQRIAVRYHLDHLNEQETKEYILHRLSVSGRSHPVFSDEAYKLIHAKSGGIPRRINHISDLALFTGFGKELSLINEEVIEDVSHILEG
jgi:general secretion pathway protein A